MKNLVFVILVLVPLMLSPAFAQNVSLDEEEKKILAEIKECELKVLDNEKMTVAEKTVAQRHCVTEIRNKYSGENYDHKQEFELKMKLENMEKCEDWYQQYKYLTYDQFMLQKNEQFANDCRRLYVDPIWDYQGEDRLLVLAQKLDSIKNLTGLNSTQNSTQKTKNITSEDQDKEDQRILELEAEIDFLKTEVAKKDAIIIEQLKVISDLANQISKIVFEQFYKIVKI